MIQNCYISANICWPMFCQTSPNVYSALIHFGILSEILLLLMVVTIYYDIRIPLFLRVCVSFFSCSKIVRGDIPRRRAHAG